MYHLKKSLGQHFLKDENVCRKIVQALQQNSFENLLEIGPGGGALTKYLLQLPDVQFKCVEIDEEKVNWLLQQWPLLEGKIVHASILDVEPPFTEPFTVVGNFPYNISTQIMFKILEWKEQVQSVTGMFQKEVARRIAASSGNKVYGILSVLLQAFFKVEYLFEVSESSFTPPPKVKSAVIRLTPLTVKPAIKSEASFFLLVKTAFNQRRKTMRNAVKNLFSPDTLQDSIFDKRAEELTVGDFAQLTYTMNEHSSDHR